jgi:hypothetical protein
MIIILKCVMLCCGSIHISHNSLKACNSECVHPTFPFGKKRIQAVLSLVEQDCKTPATFSADKPVVVTPSLYAIHIFTPCPEWRQMADMRLYFETLMHAELRVNGRIRTVKYPESSLGLQISPMTENVWFALIGTTQLIHLGG